MHHALCSFIVWSDNCMSTFMLETPFSDSCLNCNTSSLSWCHSGVGAELASTHTSSPSCQVRLYGLCRLVRSSIYTPPERNRTYTSSLHVATFDSFPCIFCWKTIFISVFTLESFASCRMHSSCIFTEGLREEKEIANVRNFLLW